MLDQSARYFRTPEEAIIAFNKMYNNNDDNEASYYFVLTDAVDHTNFNYGLLTPFLLNSVYKAHKMVDEYLCLVMLDSGPPEGSHGVLSDEELKALEQALTLCGKSNYENDLLTRDYLDIGNMFITLKNNVRAEYCLKMALEFYKKIDSKTEIYDYVTRGEKIIGLLIQLNRNNEARNMLKDLRNKAPLLSETSSGERAVADSQINLALYYARTGDIKTALDIVSKIQYNYFNGSVYAKIAVILRQSGEIEKSTELFQKAITINNDITTPDNNDTMNIEHARVMGLVEIIECSLHIGEAGLAEKMISLAEQALEKENNISKMALSHIYAKVVDLYLSLDKAEKACEIVQKNNDPKERNKLLLKISDYYHKHNQLDKTEQCLKEAWTSAERIFDSYFFIDCMGNTAVQYLEILKDRTTAEKIINQAYSLCSYTDSQDLYFYLGLMASHLITFGYNL